MKIEAVLTSVGCADLLAHTLPHNRSLFDRLIVLTAPEDEATKRVCDHWSVEYKATDAFASRWGLFRKGSGINDGLNMLTGDGWIAHLDADIVLPSHFRASIENADLDPECIHGCDRQMFRSYQEWVRFYEDPAPQIEDDLLIHPENGARLGARVYLPLKQGWIPLGFFQLWNPSASGIRRYVDIQEHAGHDDAVFAYQWPRRKRAMIPEIIAYHLESEPLPMGANWKKRTSRPFGLDAAERKVATY